MTGSPQRSAPEATAACPVLASLRVFSRSRSARTYRFSLVPGSGTQRTSPRLTYV